MQKEVILNCEPVTLICCDHNAIQFYLLLLTDATRCRHVEIILPLKKKKNLRYFSLAFTQACLRNLICL